MARILVTGGSGFIGRHVVKQLSGENHTLTCLVRSTSDCSGIERFSPRLVTGEIRDPASLDQAVRGQDMVVHLAGLTRSVHRQTLRDVNVVGARNVVEACARQETPPVLVHVSSLAAAGPAGKQPRRVGDVIRPVSRYGQSKLAGERAVRELADRVPVSVLRPPVVLGEGDRDGLAFFTPIVRWGVHVVPGWQNHPYSIVHAADLAASVSLVLHRGDRVRRASPEGTYFVPGAETTTWAGLGRMIGQAAGRARIWILPVATPLVWPMGLAGEWLGRIRGRPAVFNLDKAREAVAGAWHCDGRELARLGFRPRPLPERLAQTVNWYRRNGWLPAPGRSRAGVFWNTSSQP